MYLIISFPVKPFSRTLNTDTLTSYKFLGHLTGIASCHMEANECCTDLWDMPVGPPEFNVDV